jgi:hypothetical protein
MFRNFREVSPQTSDNTTLNVLYYASARIRADGIPKKKKIWPGLIIIGACNLL